MTSDEAEKLSVTPPKTWAAGVPAVAHAMEYSLSQTSPVLAAVSAPSSLAADLATESGLTLVGFLRGSSMNIYAGPGRVRSGAASLAQ